MAHCQKVQWTESSVVIELLFDNMIVRARGDTLEAAMLDLSDGLKSIGNFEPVVGALDTLADP